MQCQDVRSQLSAYLEGELGVAPRRVVEDHLRECVRCQRELVLLQRTVALLRGLDEVEVPARLADAVGARIAPRKTFDWGRLASWLFFPIHVKLPIQAVALLLVSLGAVYLYRSAPELSQAPQPPVATESAPRGEVVPSTAAGRADRLDRPTRQEAAEKSSGQREPQKERKVPEQEDAAARALRKSAPESAVSAKPAEEAEALRERDIGARVLRKEAPAGATIAAPLQDVMLETSDPARAVVRITEIVSALEGKVEVKEERHLILLIPAKAYSQFLTALKDSGYAVSTPTESPAAPSPEGTVTFSLRLTP
ncbi:MAG: anti-sigma factor family protein [Candidatus Methylomirabilales bacterium]